VCRKSITDLHSFSPNGLPADGDAAVAGALFVGDVPVGGDILIITLPVAFQILLLLTAFLVSQRNPDRSGNLLTILLSKVAALKYVCSSYKGW
jgi:hypothetical protein